MNSASQPLLGQVISVHRGRIFAGGPVLYGGLILAVASGHAVFVTGNRFVIFGAGIPALLMLFVSVRKWNQTLTLHQHGFVWRHGFRREVVRWWDVLAARPSRLVNVSERGMESHAEYRIEVETTTGMVLTLTDALRDLRATEGYFTTAARGPHA